MRQVRPRATFVLNDFDVLEPLRGEPGCEQSASDKNGNQTHSARMTCLVRVTVLFSSLASGCGWMSGHDPYARLRESSNFSDAPRRAEHETYWVSVGGKKLKMLVDAYGPSKRSFFKFGRYDMHASSG